MTEDNHVPQVFALVRDTDESCHIVSYCMVLPDGSAYSVSWPISGISFYSASGAEETAALRRADLLWISDRT